MKALSQYTQEVLVENDHLSPLSIVQNLSHHVKSPVSAIKHNTQLLHASLKHQPNALLAYYTKYINRINTQTETINCILQDSLSILKYQEASSTELALEKLPSEVLLKELTVAFENYYPNTKFKLEEKDRVIFNVDKTTFLLALKKLINLSLEVSQEEKPRVSFGADQADIVVTVVAPELKIRPREFESIFNPMKTESSFHQVDALPIRLALVKKLLKLNKADVRIEYSADQEIQFKIYLDAQPIMKAELL